MVVNTEAIYCIYTVSSGTLAVAYINDYSVASFSDSSDLRLATERSGNRGSKLKANFKKYSSYSPCHIALAIISV